MIIPFFCVLMYVMNFSVEADVFSTACVSFLPNGLLSRHVHFACHSATCIRRNNELSPSANHGTGDSRMLHRR